MRRGGGACTGSAATGLEKYWSGVHTSFDMVLTGMMCNGHEARESVRESD